jgi:DNA (cytosine-5)-methyltransferase 1
MDIVHLIEHFAGAGMARLGLSQALSINCLFANDYDEKKAKAYRWNFPGSELSQQDIQELSTAEVPGTPDIAWASPPCVDISIAGHGAGLRAERSIVALNFLWQLRCLVLEDRGPKIVVIENVDRLIASNGGRDLAALIDHLSSSGYCVGAFVIDAKEFVPQSRKRVFILATRIDIEIPMRLMAKGRLGQWHPVELDRVLKLVSPRSRAGWIWWKLPMPPRRTNTLADLLDAKPKGVKWDTKKRTQQLLSKMSPDTRRKLAEAQATNRPVVWAVFQRSRDVNGKRVQRVEPRFDGLAGCLLAAKGGSSCQRLLFIHGKSVRSRRLSSREAARLMGLPKDYILPERFGEAMRLIGDGVVVPVVEHIARHLIGPILSAAASQVKLAA